MHLLDIGHIAHRARAAYRAFVDWRPIHTLDDAIKAQTSRAEAALDHLPAMARNIAERYLDKNLPTDTAIETVEHFLGACSASLPKETELYLVAEVLRRNPRLAIHPSVEKWTARNARHFAG